MSHFSSRLFLRPLAEADMPALFDICLRTADGGKDATALFSDARLPGFIWAAPYGQFEPDFAFILADGDKAVGYVIGAPDTGAFLDRLDAEWWPYVREELKTIAPSRPLDEMALARIHAPERTKGWLLKDYPAHLHINIVEEAQSSGWGRKMIEAELNALKSHGVAGVHLGVHPLNERAKGFYRHIGFEDLSRDGNVIFAMKLNG
ncbi:GNAT family N-acetyltransferase [Allorhizobium sp. BGMRC 0089]|uniref:GNAT family N-acetyltransferase n=1 Tax=Allorhizobium sonneratiae TaxID=2934936 RepID=UPI002034691C|nr:GNAT family N-acetyltransferase [Allorhizobium sonneratiae]MCM2293101.1 GNAT family N-acetyltransferase [Allorhizobium sonneratiae]